MRLSAFPRRRVAVAAATAVTIAVSLSVGLANALAQTHATTNLTVLAQASAQDAWNAWIKNYEAANPSVSIDIQFVPVTNYPQQLLTELQGGNGPDIMYTVAGSGQIDSALPLAQAGRLADLSKEPWAKRVPDAAKPLVIYKNKTVALPLGILPQGIVYNVGMFQQNKWNVPTTFAQLLALCKTVKAAGKVPIEIAGGSPLNTGLLGQVIAASTVYSKDPNWSANRLANKTTFDGTTGWHQVIEMVQDMNNTGCFQAGAAGTAVPQVFAALGTGNAAMIIGPSLAVNQVTAINSSQTIAMTPFPGFTPAQTRADAGYTDSVAVNNGSKNKAEAIKFVDFIAHQGQARIYTHVASAISLHDANVGIVPTSAALYGPFLKAHRVVPQPNSSWANGQVYIDLANGITGVLTGQTSSVDSVLQAMDQAWNTPTS